MKRYILILISSLALFLIECRTSDTVSLSIATPKFSEEDQALFTEVTTMLEEVFSDYATITKTINYSVLTNKVVFTRNYEPFNDGWVIYSVGDFISTTVTKSGDIYNLTEVRTLNGEEYTYNRYDKDLYNLLWRFRELRNTEIAKR